MNVIRAYLALLPILFFGFNASATRSACDDLNKRKGMQGGWVDNNSGGCELRDPDNVSPTEVMSYDDVYKCGPGQIPQVFPDQKTRCVDIPATAAPTAPAISKTAICTTKQKEANNGVCPGAAAGPGGGVASPDLAMICPPFQAQVQKCLDDTDEAKDSNCNYKKNKDTTNFMSMADGIVKMLGATTGMSIQMACTKMKDISQLANGAMLAFKSYCLVGQKNCTSSCEVATDMRKNDPRLSGCDVYGDWNVTLNSSNRTCKGLTGTVDDAGAHLMTMYATQLNAQKCDELTTANLQAYCETNPNDPMCGTTVADCSNAATAASNTICICQSNPNDSRCKSSGSSSTTASSSGASGSSTADGTAAGLNGLSGAGLNLTGLEGDAGFDPSTAATRGASAGNQTGGKGTGRNIGGGDGPAGAGKPQGGGFGAAGNGASTKVLGGYYGGTGGGFGSGSGSGSSGSGSNGYQGGNGSGNGAAPVDLKQFLPGGKNDPSRSLAGISGPDGITGPNSDIWLKVNTRYRSVGPTMKP